MGTLTRGQISKKKFEVGPEVVQPGPELVQPGPEVVQVGPLLVHSNISSTVLFHRQKSKKRAYSNQPKKEQLLLQRGHFYSAAKRATFLHMAQFTQL